MDTANIRKNDYLDSDSDNEVLSIYLNEINRIPLLTHDEETELAIKAKAGDKAARERLISSNLRFVVSVAKKFRGQGLPLLDLINEGNIGLITAIDKFEPDKGYHFISYAVWWIRQSILKAIPEKSRAVRLPLNRSNELMQILKAKKALMHTMETAEPTVEDIANETGLDAKLISDLLAVSSEMMSFDSPVKKGEDGSSTYGDFLEDESAGPETQMMDKALKEEVSSLLDILTDKERDIIIKRNGLDGNEAMSLKEIGEGYSLTKERIRQIEKRALEKLRAESIRRGMDAFMAS